jgi:hypothetical protein
MAANYAFERTVKSPRNHRYLRAAAQRERYADKVPSRHD